MCARLRALLYAGAFVCTGCGPSALSMPVGTPHTPLATRCGARIERISMQQAFAKYTEVGRVCLSPRTSEDPSIEVVERDEDSREMLEERACALGGNILVPAGFCTTGSGRASAPGIEVAVFAETTPNASTGPSPANASPPAPPAPRDGVHSL